MKIPYYQILAIVSLFAVVHSADDNDSDQQATKKEVCMKDLGCFSITSDFKSLRYRPINKLPLDRVTINTRHLLYTRKNSKVAQQLDPGNKNSITKSNFNPKNPIRFIVHGFMDNEVFGPWLGKMKDEFLLLEDSNIIIVDWSGGNKLPYFQACANTRVVGAEIAFLITTLGKLSGVKPENCHIIGHSLGAHVAGYAGERLKKLGRITGCDPAEPYFEKMPKSVRLDPTDADYVDVIHTDARDSLVLGLGMKENVGHVDFFPNNGQKQPGCKKVSTLKTFIIEGFNEGARRLFSCNHQRALDFMHYSINHRSATPVAYQCSDWKSFAEGKCTECGSDLKKCAIMGFRADEYKPLVKGSSTQQEFYIKTGNKAPFWVFHYQVSVKMSKKSSSVSDAKGYFEISIHGSQEDLLAKLEKEDEAIKHGTVYTYLLTTDKDLGTIKRVSLKWYNSSKNPLKFLKTTKIAVDYISIVSMDKIEKSPRNTKDNLYCASKSTPLAPKTSLVMQKNSKCK